MGSSRKILNVEWQPPLPSPALHKRECSATCSARKPNSSSLERELSTGWAPAQDLPTVLLRRATNKKVHSCRVSVTQSIKNLPVMQETRVQSLGQEDPLEKGMATHSSSFAWRVPWIEPGGLQFMRLQRVEHDWETNHYSWFTQVRFLFGWLAMPHNIQDLSFPTVGPTPPAIEVQSPNHRTASEFPIHFFLIVQVVGE